MPFIASNTVFFARLTRDPEVYEPLSLNPDSVDCVDEAVERTEVVSDPSECEDMVERRCTPPIETFSPEIFSPRASLRTMRCRFALLSELFLD